MPSPPIAPTIGTGSRLQLELHCQVVGRVRARKKMGAEHSALIC